MYDITGKGERGRALGLQEKDLSIVTSAFWSVYVARWLHEWRSLRLEIPYWSILAELTFGRQDGKPYVLAIEAGHAA